MDLERLQDLAREALANGTEEQALAVVAPAAERAGAARLWQWAGLLQRSMDQHQAALRSFEQAAQLAPQDPGIAHGHARVALEAGVDATMLFERARSLAPADAGVLLGLAAARFAIGRGEEAAAELAQVVAQVPLWQEGHRQLAQLQSMLGRPELAGESIERAIAAAPSNQQLWRLLFDLNARSSDFEALAANVERGATAGVAADDYRAIAAGELGIVDIADRLFAAATGPSAAALRVWHIRHLIRTDRAESAAELVEQGIAGSDARSFWPYASIVWRLTGDRRSHWLHGEGDRFVRALDLPLTRAQLDGLAARLRTLHVAMGQYLDQSVRGGTQTDGPLFSRIEPEIRELRAAIVDAVQAYVEALSEPDPTHPLLGPPRDRRVRFSGSWSVRLRDSGRHANHVHSQGWISSAFYVSLPQFSADEPPESGWLTIGEPPPELNSGLEAERAVEPKPGRLVLFPSWMWHGTRPFRSGERLTVAFDVRLPV